MLTKPELFKDFFQNGNTITGEPISVSASSAILFDGTDSVIQIGEDVTFIDLRIEMPEGGAKLIIGNGVQLRGLIQISAGGVISIGENTIFNRKCHLSAWEGASIHIGKECLFSNVEIRTSDMHSIVNIATGKRINAPRDTVIEDRVWLGESVTIYKGVTVGCGSIIGGHSVVTKPIGRFVCAAGVPAEVKMTEVTWQRGLITMKPKKAGIIGSQALMPTKAELSKLINDKKFTSVVFCVSEYMQLSGKEFEDLEIYAQFYLAKAHLELGELDLARTYLTEVMRAKPNHKVAGRLLAAFDTPSM